MAFKATLELDGSTYKLNNVSFSLDQPVDHRHGKPAGMVTPGPINIDVDVSGKTMKPFWEWSSADDMMKDGTVKFYKIDDGESAETELLFENSYITNFHVSMHQGASSMNASMVIHARKIEIDGCSVEMEWEAEA